MTVLVADDQPVNRKLLRVSLGAEGFTILEAADGQEGLAALERDSVEAVISDILMPGMDGFRFCQAVRRSERFGHLPFIIYTSTYTSASDEKLALNAGADRFIRKPCPTSVLIAALKEAVAAAERRALNPPRLPDELEVTREYSEALVKKLEEKNEELAKAKGEWERTFNSVPDLIAVLDDQYRITRANQAMADRLGLAPEQCVGLHCYQVMHGSQSPPACCPHSLTLKEGRPQSAEVLEDRLGGVFLVTTTPLKDAEGRVQGTVHVARDITEQKSAEKERQTAADFLALANAAASTSELIRSSLAFFQSRSGCSAAGIRLKAGDDYPYYQTAGLPPQFVAADSRLLALDAAGEALRDGEGNPVLECLCGSVISGRADRSRPYFTAFGSFWTNSAPELQAAGAEDDRLARFRTHCNDEGYESVALVPLAAGSQRLGLLQLNDRRKGMFSPATMALWERLAGHLAVALAKFRAEDELRALNETLERQVAERTALAESRARKLQALAIQLTEAEERERQRIAELLHDDLQQVLAGARMQLQVIRQTLPGSQALLGVEQLLEESIGKSRQLARELSPTVLRQGGLRAGLEWLAAQMKKQFGLEVGLEAGAEVRDQVPLAMQAFLFRSVQELLFNVVKHAQVERARLSLGIQDGRLTVSVSDDGRGFDPAIQAGGKTAGFGLPSIRERVQAVGGTLSTESSPGAGSRFTIVVPL